MLRVACNISHHAQTVGPGCSLGNLLVARLLVGYLSLEREQRCKLRWKSIVSVHVLRHNPTRRMTVTTAEGRNAGQKK